MSQYRLVVRLFIAVESAGLSICGLGIVYSALSPHR